MLSTISGDEEEVDLIAQIHGEGMATVGVRRVRILVSIKVIKPRDIFEDAALLQSKVVYETTDNLIAHRQGDQKLPAVLLVPEHLDIEVGVRPIPLDDGEEEVLARPEESRHLEGELSLESVTLDVTVVEDSVGLLGDAGEGVGAVPEDVLLDRGVADLLLAAVGGAGDQPVAAAHPVRLHLGEGKPGRATPPMVSAPVLDLLDDGHRQQGGRLGHLGPAHRAARVDALVAGLADAVAARAGEDRARARHLKADRTLDPVLQLLGEVVQLVLVGGALPSQLHHHPFALHQSPFQVYNPFLIGFYFRRVGAACWQGLIHSPFLTFQPLVIAHKSCFEKS